MTFNSTTAYVGAQIPLILGDENRWFTGERIGHNPNEDELVQNWINSGAAEKFSHENPFVHQRESTSKT